MNDPEPTADEWLRAQARPSVEHEHLEARLAAVNSAELDDTDEETQ